MAKTTTLAWAAAAALMLPVPVAAAPAAHADTTTVTVAVSNSSPVLGNHYLGDSSGAGCYLASSGSALRYEVYQLNVTVPDVYTFTDLVDSGNTDMYVAVYPLGAFDPASIATGCISTGDESAQLDLSAATSYTLVAAAYSGQVNSPTQVLGLDGPGEAYLGPARSVPASGVPMWVQGYARTTAGEACLDGWDPSWEQWPNGGAGGWVCTRAVPALG